MAVSSNSNAVSPLTYNLLIALVVLLLVSLLSIGSLFLLRRIRRRRRQQQLLPMHQTELSPGCSSNHRRSTSVSMSSSPLQASEAFSASGSEKFILHSGAQLSRSTTPLPEIRVHLPDEVDETGKQAPGKVVVVQVGESFGPADDDLPPSYRREASPHQPLVRQARGVPIGNAL